MAAGAEFPGRWWGIGAALDALWGECGIGGVLDAFWVSVGLVVWWMRCGGEVWNRRCGGYSGYWRFLSKGFC